MNTELKRKQRVEFITDSLDIREQAGKRDVAPWGLMYRAYKGTFLKGEGAGSGEASFSHMVITL